MAGRWITTSPQQVAHLLPDGWKAGPPRGSVRAACGAGFRRASVIQADRTLPAERHAVLHCYRCSCVQARGEGDGAAQAGERTSK